MQLNDHLREREAEGNPILVGLVGCGQMGSGLMHVMHAMAGMEAAVVSDIDVNRPLAALQAMGIPREAICITDRPGIAEDALAQGQYVVTQDALLVAQLEGLDAVVEATGLTEVGALVAWNGILAGKHVIMLNVETDVTVGPLLSRVAEQAGVVYTAAFGDEPGVCKMLYNQAQALGFEIVCVGKGKNNAIDFDATPDSCREEALSRGMNPKMLAAFKDGSKTMVEMAAVSNATGLIPDVPGMHGARVDVPDLCKVFVPRADGGLFSGRGRVEYSTGKVAPGVFVIVATDDPRIATDMGFVGMGPGPFFTLYRPYHLCNIETPLAVAEAVLYGEETISSKRMVSEVVAVAKRDLRPGEIVGEVGGPDYFNRIYTYGEAVALGGMPMGLTSGGRVTQPVRKGELLTHANLAPDVTRFAYKLRQMQDAMPEMA
jgi:predicted homoserine dehydrogenase-like protein